MSFPHSRMRRIRRTPAMRRLVRETHVAPRDLILPLFVQHGNDVREPIEGLPGHHRLSIDHAVEQCAQAAGAGLAGVMLFGIPATKDDVGTEAWDSEGIVQLAVRAIKEQVSDLVVATDVCLCQYTSHGHCGVLDDEGNVLNDVSLELLGDIAVSHARAGADIVAPSDMMDGRVRGIRGALDSEHLTDTAILSYSSKFASALYGPFRSAAGSSPAHGDRRSYQMDPANGREAVRESVLDEEEGADMLMVKPALACLDVIRDVREATTLPIAAYHVSGEYAMVKAAADRGWLDERDAMLESLTAIKRAGADTIVTYAGLEAAAWLADL